MHTPDAVAFVLKRDGRAPAGAGGLPRATAQNDESLPIVLAGLLAARADRHRRRALDLDRVRPAPGVVPEPVTPPIVLVLLVPATCWSPNVVAAWPARVAGRVRPAVVLRTE